MPRYRDEAVMTIDSSLLDQEYSVPPRSSSPQSLKSFFMLEKATSEGRVAYAA